MADHRRGKASTPSRESCHRAPGQVPRRRQARSAVGGLEQDRVSLPTSSTVIRSRPRRWPPVAAADAQAAESQSPPAPPRSPRGGRPRRAIRPRLAVVQPRAPPGSEHRRVGARTRPHRGRTRSSAQRGAAAHSASWACKRQQRVYPIERLDRDRRRPAPARRSTSQPHRGATAGTRARWRPARCRYGLEVQRHQGAVARVAATVTAIPSTSPGATAVPEPCDSASRIGATSTKIPATAAKLSCQPCHRSRAG